VRKVTKFGRGKRKIQKGGATVKKGARGGFEGGVRLGFPTPIKRDEK